MDFQDLTFNGFEKLRDESGAMAFRRIDGKKLLRITKCGEKYIATLYVRFPIGTQARRFSAVSPAVLSRLLLPFVA